MHREHILHHQTTQRPAPTVDEGDGHMNTSAKKSKGPTLADFLAFCDGKPADEKFSIYSCSHCAVGQFARHLGYRHGSHSDFTIDTGDRAHLPIKGLTKEIMNACDGTFGHLASLIRAAA
jgi:hypothetical protein